MNLTPDYYAVETLKVHHYENMGQIIHNIGGAPLFIGIMVLLILSPMIVCEIYTWKTKRSLTGDIKEVFTREIE